MRSGRLTIAGPLQSALGTGTGVLVALLAGRAAAAQSSAFCAADNAAVHVTEVGVRIDSLLQGITEIGAFSGTVLIMRGDQVLLQRGYGLATENPCSLANAETVYHIGSLAKQFAAAAALRLEERGRWSLQDPISRFLTNAPPDKRQITLHELLTHTSGLLPDVVDYGAENQPLHRDSMLARILRSSLASAPGAKYVYSNAGYTLLAFLIERVAGEPIQRFFHRELFAPARLSRTGFVGESERLHDGVIAGGFWGRYEVPAPARTPSWAIMPGEVLSTVGDMARWYRALRGGRIVSPASVDKMFSLYAADYGYGWHIRKRADGSVGVIFHNGDQGMHAVAFRHYPQTDVIAVAATNRVVQDAKQHDDVLNNALEVLAGASIDLPAASHVSSADRPTPGLVRVGTSVFQLIRGPAGDLWLAAQSADAFRTLWGHTPEYEARVAAAQQRVTAFEDSLTRASIRCDSNRREPINGYARQYVGEWTLLRCDLENELGRHTTSEVIGAQPLSWSRTRVLVFRRHVHERGSRVVTWLFDSERPVEAWQSPDVDHPQSLKLAQTTEGYLVFDWFSGESARIHFERAVGGTLQMRLEPR